MNFKELKRALDCLNELADDFEIKSEGCNCLDKAVDIEIDGNNKTITLVGKVK